jgi:hypothetical protein
MARTLKAESVDKGKALTNTRFVVLFVEACHLKNDKKTLDIGDWVAIRGHLGECFVSDQ